MVAGDHKRIKGKALQSANGATCLGDVPLEVADFFTDIRKPLIRSSPVGTFDHCPRAFLYEYKLGIKARTYDSALNTGSLTHGVLQCLFMGQSKDQSITTTKKVSAKVDERLVEIAGPSGFLPDGKDLATVLVQMNDDMYKAIAIAFTFWEKKKHVLKDFEVLRDPEGNLMVERMVQVKVPEFTQELRCPCDLVLRKKGTNEVWILDFKTTSYDPQVRAAGTAFSPQIKIYRLALATVLSGWDQDLVLKGSFHAILQKPTIKFCPKTKDKAGFHSYVQRVIEWYEKKEDADGNNAAMVLDPNVFTGPLIDQEFKNRIKQYCAAANASPNVQNFYRAGDSACTKFGKVCPYMKLCSSSFIMWPDLIRSYYEINFREDEEDG